LGLAQDPSLSLCALLSNLQCLGHASYGVRKAGDLKILQKKIARRRKKSKVVNDESWPRSLADFTRWSCSAWKGLNKKTWNITSER
jgi:hypothetical protein